MKKNILLGILFTILALSLNATDNISSKIAENPILAHFLNLEGNLFIQNIDLKINF